MLQKVYVEITTDCNLQCGMCIRHNWEDPIHSMSRETFGNLVSQLREMPSVWMVNFSGFGEPTVHRLFLEFLLAVKEAGLGAELVTNGIALETDFLKKLIELELDKLIVSLDGVGSSADGAFHSDCLDRVHASLRNLYAMKIGGKLKRPEVGIQFVVSQRNVGELPALKRLAWKLGFSSILVSNLVPPTLDLAADVLYQQRTTPRWDGRPSVWNPTVDLPRLDPRSEARQALEKLCAVGTRVRVGGNDVVGGAMYCRFVNEGRVAIAPDGSVSPCLPLLHNYSYYFREEKRRIKACHFGNVNRNSLQEIWEGAGYQAFRKRVQDFEFSPCIDCGGCDLRETNEEDCFGNGFPSCGECLWAAGLVQCP
jgi:MoaA/NifB/PqqE/SkfB family radical SAM enzyme